MPSPTRSPPIRASWMQAIWSDSDLGPRRRGPRFDAGTVGNWTLCSDCWAEEGAFPLTIRSTQGRRTGHRCKGREIEDARDRRWPRHCAAASMPCFVSGFSAVRRGRTCAVGRVHQSGKVRRNLLDDGHARHAGRRSQPRHDIRGAVCPARTAEDVRDRPRAGRARPWETARLYRAHGRLFRGRPTPEDHRPHRGENLSRLQLDSGRPARRHRIAPRQVQRLARIAGATGGGRRRPDGGRADRTRHEGKGVRA